jgi:hypothetical protein
LITGAGQINVEGIVAGKVFSVSRFSASCPNEIVGKSAPFTKNVKGYATRKFKPTSRDAPRAKGNFKGLTFD